MADVIIPEKSERERELDAARRENMLALLNRSTPGALTYTLEPFGTGWFSLKINGDGFGSWPEPIATSVVEALAHAAMLQHSHVHAYKRVAK